MNQNFAFLTSSQSIIEYYIIHKVLKKDKKLKNEIETQTKIRTI